jgi:hypothetical protein
MNASTTGWELLNQSRKEPKLTAASATPHVPRLSPKQYGSRSNRGNRTYLFWMADTLVVASGIVPSPWSVAAAVYITD